MSQFLIVSREPQLEAYKELATEYDLGFEINDFFDPAILDDEDRIARIIDRYKKLGLPAHSTMHGAFYDVVVFSQDAKIRDISKKRIYQSMEIAKRLHVDAVVFHTNYMPMLDGAQYNDCVVNLTSDFLRELLPKYKGISIYLENMFDDSPLILARIAKNLCKEFENFGICLDYAHASISKTPIETWVTTLAPYIKHIHINDNDLIRDLHWPLGLGKIDMLQFIDYYERYFKDCSVLIETNEVEDQRTSIVFLNKALAGDFEKTVQEKLEQTNPAEHMLEHIFHYMTRIAQEKGFVTTIRLLTEMGQVLVNAERASFWYWDKKKKQYWTMAAVGSERITVEEGSGIVGAAIENAQTIVIQDPYHDSRFNPEVDRATGFKTKSILCMPVKNSHGDVIGAYQAINKLGSANQAFDEADQKRLTLASVYCGKELESHLLYHAAQMDQLTGLKNRRGFYEYYADEVNTTLDTNCASVIMCDIDFFKKVNDTYGHNAGDAVLMLVADILRQGVSGRGEVIRWGGEEFILLLPKMNLLEATDCAEKIRQKVEQTVCQFENLEIKITMSFGVKELDKTRNADENVELVDARLYHAKQTGRNRVVNQDE